MSEHKYNEAYSKGYRDGQKDQCLADAIDDALAMLNKVGIVTNGDVIKAMFPNALKSNYIDIDNKSTLYINDYELEVDIDWWNAPYKRGSENGSN